jgi:DNA polymerase III delta prime subunit
MQSEQEQPPINVLTNTIILLCGPAGSGKDTSYEILKNHLFSQNCNWEISKYSFGRVLKDIVVYLSRLFINADFSADAMDGLAYKEVIRPEYKLYAVGSDEQPQPLVIRTLLQQVGTDILRKQLGDDIFAKALITKIDEQFKKPINQIAIVADLRFPNEQQSMIEFCNKNGYKCITIYIERNSRINNAAHSSESYYNSLQKDIIINNNGTLHDLSENLRVIRNASC